MVNLKKRNFGLDCVRALAIVLVLFDHSGYFFLPTQASNNTLFIFGFYGVELFFVLSGFLIGEIIVKQFSSGFSMEHIKQFYLRRWMRTLPLYYVVLVLSLIADSILHKNLNFHLSHFVFLQNFNATEREFFKVSWSLAIEEWFYLLLPLLFLCYVKIANTSKKLFRVLLITICCIFLLRFFVILTYHLSFDTLRIFVPLRFDSLLIGVLLAAVKVHYKKSYQLLATKKLFFTAVFLMLINMVYFLYIYLHSQLSTSVLFTSIGFTVTSLLFACFIPFSEKSAFLNVLIPKNKIVYKTITTVSVLSYSLYLLHLEIFTLCILSFQGRISPFFIFLIAGFVTYFSSFAAHKIIEKPIMDLRDKLSLIQFPKFWFVSSFTK